MSEQKDFMALGQYVDAKERVSSLHCDRHNLAGDLSRSLNKATMSMSTVDSVSVFDHEQFLRKAEQLAEVNKALEVAIADMDKFSVPAQKPPMHRNR
ncbi:hypothetical protein [Pseudomonas canadensis]|uniref:hypothetical protein n=1 Tax=Pseudomonas canadensis TaxID=915099 RepID=UPI003B9E421E